MDARYAIERKIASGGMATVYLGRSTASRPAGSDLTAARPVAIKICHPHLLEAGGREHRTQALLDEGRIASRIHHPNVVAVLDVVVQDDSVMIVMEYVEGVTVAGLVRGAARADTPVPVDVALRVTADALAGLHAAHELHDGDRDLGVVHRDVSPQNILIGVDGSAKLADFGVFKGAQRLAPSTETGDLKGKLGYVAPEVYRGEALTRRADIYSVGVVLWEMLAGRRLFDDSTHAALMHRVLAGRVTPLSTIRDDVPYELDAVLARALALDPADRFATAEELAQSLERLPVSAAPARTVAWHVRAAMETEPPRESAPCSKPTDDVANGPMGDVLTPSDYVTPVRASRPPQRMPRSALAVAGGLLIVLVVGGAALVRSPAMRGTTTNASLPARAPHVAGVIEATPALPIANARASTSATVRPAVHTPPASAVPAAGRAQTVAPARATPAPFYDPKEL